MYSENKAQEEAVKTHKGQLILISCPGSGKTTTMIRRIGNMVESGINPENIVMVTFTDAAAKEMKERYIQNYGISNVTFCTIHSLCLKIIQRYSKDVMSIIPTETQYSIIRQVFREQKIKSNISDTAKSVLTDISAVKNSMVDISAFKPVSLDTEAFRRVYEGYENEKKSLNMIDFDDMLYNALHILKTNPTALNELRQKYQYLMCDEYQDTNAVQKEILYLLAGTDGNICVVGDDDQSIYGFRGASPKIMRDFVKDYPNAKKIIMDTNYRSEPEIIKYAKNLIDHNTTRFEKDIKAHKDGNGNVYFQVSNDRNEELEWVANEIGRLIADGSDPSQIAILTRTNAQLEEISAVLEEKGINYTSAEPIKDNYEHFIYRDILSYLKLMNGDWSDEAFLRILNRPTRWAKESLFRGIEPYNLDKMLEIADKHTPYQNQLKQDIKKLYVLLTKHKNEPLRIQLQAIIKEGCYPAYLHDYAENIGVDPAILLSKLEFFKKEAAKYVEMSNWYVAAKKHVYAHRQSQKRKSQDSILLSTMHRSKGLEWDNVFIIDCCQSVMPGQGIISADNGNSEIIEEERRLFYVAMTRARERLYLARYAHTEAKTKKGDQPSKFKDVVPCMFLKESQTDIAALRKKKEENLAKRKDAINAVIDGFAEGKPSRFTVGMEVNHSQYGHGIVVHKNIVFVRISFDDCGVKVFKL